MEDEATGNAFEVFEFRKPQNRLGRTRVPRDRAWDTRELRKHLVSKNWDAPRGDKRADEIVAEAAAKEPGEHWLCAAHVGWRPNMDGFVLHDGVLGSSGANPKLKPPLWLNNAQGVELKRRGDLQVWIDAVARPSRYSSHMMLSIAAAFAGPLVRTAGLQPFVISVFGDPKIGKSTVLLTAASVVGIGEESHLPNFNTSDPSFHEKARLFSDLVFPCNEIGLLKGAKKDAYSRIRTFIYTFAEGRDAARHSQSSYATAASSATWRGILLANAEQSVDALAKLAGQARDGGEYARWIDVPATAKGRARIFDRRPRSVTKARYPAWARDRLRRLRQACEAHHGVALKPFLRHVMSLGDRAPEIVRGHMAEFDATLAGEIEDGALRHAARNFALVYAGGRLAIEAGVLPWKPKRLLSAVVRCFRAALRNLNRREDASMEARRTLRRKLASVQLPLRGDGIDPEHHAGFREGGPKETVYTVKATTLRSWFSGDAEFRAALAWLDGGGHLLKSDPARKPRGKNTEWAITTPRWNKKRKVKSVRFKDPFRAEHRSRAANEVVPAETDDEEASVIRELADSLGR